MTITSQHNRKLKEIRKLRQRRRWRERSGRFVAEGEDLLAAADAAGWEAVERYSAAGSGLPGIEVGAELLTGASGLASGTRTLAVYDERWATAAVGPLCLYLHGVHDPGNVGTILRGAEAFGAASVVLGPGCADPFGPKAVRASMGAVFAVPLVRADGGDLGGLPGVKIALVPGEGLPLSELSPVSATPRHQMAKVPELAELAKVPELAELAKVPELAELASVPMLEPDRTLLIGSEREGLPRALIDAADVTAHIPTETDSLNAAMAATIALYELRSRMAAR
jgi:RNA methyltransferase, TrmH family